jgi:hypothetical protein
MQAHQHVENAENYVAQGLLIPASEEHYKAAEAFKACIEQTTDESVSCSSLVRAFSDLLVKARRMMARLSNEHSKAGRELQRKIVKLQEENKDPTLPQVISPAPSSTTYTPLESTLRPLPSPPPRRMTDSQGTVDESFMVLGQRVSLSLVPCLVFTFVAVRPR